MKGPKREIRIETEFRCPRCGKVEITPPTVTPTCCGAAMDMGKDRVLGGDPEDFRLDLVQCWAGDIFRAPESVFKVPDEWDPAYEVWVFRRGRHGGERIGWLGCRSGITWEYKLVPGIPSVVAQGSAPTREEALAQLWYGVQ